MPKRAELQNVHVTFQRLAFELRDRSPAFELARVMPILRPEGLRFKVAIDNMRAGRALEYKNVRFRMTGLLNITATVQVTAAIYTLDDAVDALAHAESVFHELQQKWAFRLATLFCKPTFIMAFEVGPKEMGADHIYYRKVGNNIEKLRDRP